MLRRGVKVQLVVFVVIALLSIMYGLVRFGGVDELVRPPYHVQLELRSSGGIYPDAQVSLLGVAVGHVSDLHPRRNGKVVVDLEIDHGARIPADVTARVASTTAVGEQYVDLTPRRDNGPLLADGDVIPVGRTSVPLPIEDLLSNLNALAASLPKQDTATALTELGAAFRDTGADLRRLLDRSTALTRTALDNQDDLIALIDDSATVLDTQVQLGPETSRMAAQLAGLTRQLRALDPDLAVLFRQGARSGRQLSGLVRDVERTAPGLFGNLLALTDVAAGRLDGLRKTLVVFPYTVEAAMTQIRYCDSYDPGSGEPIERTCHYDPRTGEPIWTAHFAFELDTPGGPQAQPCLKGYEGTRRYLPNGQPADGAGARQPVNAQPNLDARCTAHPADPERPNVRGAQNAVRGPASEPVGDGLTSVEQRVVINRHGSDRPVLDHLGPPPPSDVDPLAWLLTGLLTQGES